MPSIKLRFSKSHKKKAKVKKSISRSEEKPTKLDSLVESLWNIHKGLIKIKKKKK